MREFPTGATRDDDATKNDYRGYLSPLVLKRFGDYMTEHRKQADGKLRDSDNWKKGIPQKEYLSSLLRHVVDLWAQIEGPNREWKLPTQTDPAIKSPREVIEDSLCAILFNAQGLLHERLLGRDVGQDKQVIATISDEPLSFGEWLRKRGDVGHYYCHLQECNLYPKYKTYLNGPHGDPK